MYNCSIAMVAMWTMGDTFKTGYFIKREAPIQFGFCGALQVIVDLAILIQVVVYQNNPSVARPATRED